MCDVTAKHAKASGRAALCPSTLSYLHLATVIADNSPADPDAPPLSGTRPKLRTFDPSMNDMNNINKAAGSAGGGILPFTPLDSPAQHPCHHGDPSACPKFNKIRIIT